MKGIFIVLSAAVLLNGCAPAAVVRQDKIPGISGKNTAEINVADLNYDTDAYVVTARKYTKLEKKRMEALRVNEKESAGNIAAMAATAAVFAAMDIYLGKDMKPGHQVLLLGASAAGAYAVSSVVQYIYELYNPRIR